MAKVTFIGDPGDEFSGPNKIVVKGEEFTKNVGKNIDNEDLLKFFDQHTHFAVGEVDFDNLAPTVAGDSDDVYDSVTNDSLRTILQAREVEFKSNTSRETLINLVKDSGGLA